MISPLEDIIITIDTREQNQKRIKAVESWGIAQGAIVEHSKLDLCDYRILGDFRGKQINIGIEAKGLSDFCSCDYEDLKRKLFDSFELYDEVALFIESANYSFLNEGFGKSAIINSAVRDGSANVCNLAVLEGCCSTLPAYGIHVRQLRSEAQFPYSIENLLTYCIHDHDIVKHDPKLYLRSYKHTLQSFMSGVQVKKAITCYPNLHWLCSASEESYKEIFGKAAGIKIYNFIRNPELVTEEWKNKHFYDGTDKVQLPEVEICDKIKGAIVDYLAEQAPHALTVDELCAHFNIMQGDEDKEAFLIYLKELAWENKIISIASGEFTINRLQSQCDPVGTFLNKNTTHSVITPKTITPTDDNNKSTEGLTPLIIPSVPLQSSSAKPKGTEQGEGTEHKLCLSKNTSELFSAHDADQGISSTITTHEPLKNKIPGHVVQRNETEPGFKSPAASSKHNVQEKDLKLASSLKSQPSLANTSNEFEPLPYIEGKETPLSTHRMSARTQLEAYLQSPHTLQECVDKHDNFTKGVIWEHVARMKREGVVIEFEDKTLVMAK